MNKTNGEGEKGRINPFLRSLPGRMIVSTLVLTALFGSLLLSSALYLSMQMHKSHFTDGARDQTHALTVLIGQNNARIEPIFKDLIASGRVVYAEFVRPDSAGQVGSLKLSKEQNLVFIQDTSFGQHDDHVYYLAEPVQDSNDKTIGSLRVGYDEGHIAEEMRHMIHRSIVFALVYVWALLLMATSLALRLTNPIKLLQKASRDIASGQIDKALNVSTDILEISSLADDLEHMRKELVARSKKIAASEARYSAILEHAGEGIVTLNQGVLIEGFNKTAEKLFGYKGGEILGTPFTRLLIPEDAAHLAGPNGMPIIADDVMFTGLRKDGETFPLLLSISSFSHGDTTLFILVAQDVSERVAYEEKLANLAYYDTLTGLPNRRLFYDRLQQTIAHAARTEKLLAVFFLDLDRFKIINDTYGHQVGDLLLKAVAERLQSIVRRRSDSIARLGGDEFTLILTNLSNVWAIEQIAQDLLKSFDKSFVLGDHEIFTSTSIGISVYPFDDSDADEIVKHADTAMYFAKKMGKDNYQFYSAEMNENSRERLALEHDLRKAVQEGSLVLHYQPQVMVACRDGDDRPDFEVIGAEALIRWQHPELGLLYPDRFIQMAEETGLIVSIGDWVLRAACEQGRAWADAGLPPMRIAVNLSARQLQDRELVRKVGRVLDETGMSPACLELEITESMVVHNTEAVIRVLKALKEIGVTIAIDDFGTGHSSLANLRYLPVDVVKIDKSFVKNMLTDINSAAIVKAVIEMTRTMGLKVVAEGVEIEDHMDYLIDHHCNIHQGYYFSRPVTAAEIELFIRGLARATDPSARSDT